jgi:hypothetical protein
MDKNNSTAASEAQDTPKKQSILADLDACPLHQKSPFGITNVTVMKWKAKQLKAKHKTQNELQQELI